MGHETGHMMSHCVQTMYFKRLRRCWLFTLLGLALSWSDLGAELGVEFISLNASYAEPRSGKTRRVRRSSRGRRSNARARSTSRRARSRSSKRSSQRSSKRKRRRSSKERARARAEREARAAAEAAEAQELAHLYGSLDVSARDVAGLSPWVSLLKSHPRFIQAERLESAKGRSGDGESHPCLYHGELKDDTCLAFNWGSAGFLKNPIALLSTDLYKTRESKNPRKGRHYGVPEMVFAIKQAVEEVHAAHEDTKRLVIGDLSRFTGGYFPPHLSHQSGRDADIGYYTKGKYQPEYLQRIRAHQLDVPRTWTFLHSFLRDDKVQYIFMDYYLQKPLYKYLKNEIKLPPRLISKYLSYPRRTGGIIRHLKGHADHIHVRFYAPQSLEAGKAYLRKHGMKAVKPVPVYYRIRRGDRLIKIARRFRVKWSKLMRWNRLTRRKARRLRVGQRLIVKYKTPPLP